MVSPLTTVYMTQEQDEQLRSTIKERQRQCQELQDQPREGRTSRDLLAQATSASLLADMAKATGSQGCESDSMPVLEVGYTYIPCTALVKDLKPIRLCDLHLNHHHRGRSLALRRIGHIVVRKTGSWTIMEDVKEPRDAERLEVVLHDQRHGEKLWESDTEFVLKDPFFTLSDNGTPTIRIDHPSDIVCSPSADCERGYDCPRKYKTDGNLALRQNDLVGAYESYTRGLELALYTEEATDNIIKDLHRNRSHINLLLGRYDEAISDALSSLTFEIDEKSRELDGKAYFRAGCAAYRLGDWQKANECFINQQDLTPEDKDAKAYLREVKARLREQAGAEYKFHQMKASFSQCRPRVDAATYIGSTKIQRTPEHGKGLFATKDIAAGEMIMCEKAFCIVWSHEDTAWTTMTYDNRDDRIRAFPAGLAQALVQKLQNNPSQVELVQALFGDHKGVDRSLTMDDNGPVIDTFQIHDIICRNAFSPGPQFGEEDVRKASAGLWIRASYMNHSCIANTEREFVGDLMVVRASKNIKAGDEITHIYNDSRDVDVRAESLMQTWGFTCSCRRCLAENADEPAVRKQRQFLEDKANAFMSCESPSNARKLLIRKAEHLAKAIEATYDAKRYEGVPRAALTNIEKWLGTARSSLK